MAFFKKKKQAAQPDKPEAAEANTVETPAPQQVTLASGRLAPVFLRMYRWIISVNLAADVYQIESGEQAFGGQPLPLRGRYSQLLELIGGKVLEEYRADFLEAFRSQALANVFLADGTGISGVYCLAETGETDFIWYEIRAERIPSANPQSLQCVFYFRRLKNGNDFGNEPQKKPKTVETDPTLDWEKIRMERLLGGKDEITFEYNVAGDYLLMHQGADSSQAKKYEHYLSRIEKESDWRIFHESIHDVRSLFKNAIDGKAGEAVIQYRTNTEYGEPFRYYRITCMPLEQTGKPTWVFGHLRDIDESHRRNHELREVTEQINSFLDTMYPEIYLIDTEKDLIRRILHTENGYQIDEKHRSFSGRIKTQIERGVIAPQSAPAYLEWLEKGFLARKTLKGSWDMEGQLKLPGKPAYRWYGETIFAVKDKPNTFLQIRRDITEIHNIRQQEFALQENLYLAHYNQSVLDIMADLVEFRNVESGLHIRHVRTLTKILLEDVAKRSPQYELGPRRIEMYCRAATTHDIGKITIPDAILNKPGRLTPDELETMRAHTTNGAKIIENMNMPGENELKELCRDVALHHHERWDGGGYPEHLQGDAVSIGTQVIGLVDAYDALVSERCYKEACSAEEAVEMILSGKCGSFNPRLLESLKACAKQIKKEYETPASKETDTTTSEVTDYGE